MLHIDPATVAAITPSAVLSAIEAHERTYGAYLYGLCDEGADLGELREAERAAFHELVHVPLANDAERVAYAVAVIARENSPVGRLGEGRGRNDPLAVAFRTLSFGEHAWEPEGGPGVAPLGGDMVDPILAVIEENRRLFGAWSAALELPYTGLDELPEVTKAREAYTAHVDDVLLKTVPTTGQGCRALAEYVHGHYVRDRYIIDENEHSDANFRVLGLIAGSPATGASQVVPAGSAANPDLAAMVAEWGTLDAKMRANAATDAESDRHAALQIAIYRFPSSSLADLHAKLPVFRDEMRHAKDGVENVRLPEEVHCYASWLGLIADIERLSGQALLSSDGDIEARALLDKIEREWNISDHLLDTGGTADEVAVQGALDRREALLKAAERLPAASLVARYTKAMALAWIMAADLLERDRARDAYATDGRLAFDVALSVTGESVATSSQVPASASPALDLSDCSIVDLARLYEAFRHGQDSLSNALQCGCFWASRGPLGEATAGGSILDLEQSRLGCMADACANEITKRVPVNQRERDEVLSTRLAHELACEGRIGDAALLRDIVEAWTPARPAAA